VINVAAPSRALRDLEGEPRLTRPYDWWDKIKPGWNPPFGRPTFESAEEAALMMMKKDVVRVGSVTPKEDNKVEVTLEVDNDPSGQCPMTIVCEQLPTAAGGH
jgi:hypothetical protein